MTNSGEFSQVLRIVHRTVFLCVLLMGSRLVRADWPTHRGDLRRSGITAEHLDPATLSPTWTWRSASEVRSAWPSPAKWDAYASLAGMKSMRNYDPVLHITAVRDKRGEAIFLPGVTDDTVRRLDARNGKEVWRFTADAPVRIAPTFHDGTLYFGSDDGCAYALDAGTGKELWRTRIVPDARWILNNGRFVSPWPVRSGVHVMDGTAYCAASFLPWESTYICALDATTGKPEGAGRYIRDLGTGWTMEGPLLLSERSIIVPQGRVPPIVIKRSDGTPSGALEGGGGSFVLLTEEDDVLHGPGNKGGWITDSSGNSRERIATYQKGNAVIIEGGIAWLLADSTLTALDRETRTLLFSTQTDTPHTLIKAGDVLFAGGEDHVSAYDPETGSLLWKAPVEGNAFGLAVSGGRLLVSTDQGALHAFEPGAERSEYAVEVVIPADVASKSLPAMPTIDDPDLIDRWIFREDLLKHIPLVQGEPRTYPVIGNEVTDRPNGRFRQLNQFEETPIGSFLTLDGSSNDLVMTPPDEEPQLPSKALTAVVVARIDETRPWGGLLNAVQDNGDNESGWILGYRDLKPGIGLRGSEGDTRYSWTLAPTPIEPGTWHVIAATFDGETTTLYVDGVSVATSTAEKGEVVYPERFWYSIGSYHDDDEYFVTKGALGEVRLYGRALEPEEIASITEPWQPLLDLPVTKPPPAEVLPTGQPAAGPIFAFTAPGTVHVNWETAAAVPTRLDLMIDGQIVDLFDKKETREEHEVTLTGLRSNRIYSVRLGIAATEDEGLSRHYQLDTSFNYTSPLIPEGRNHPLAKSAIERTGIDRGLAVVLGAKNPEVATTLARLSQLRVVILDDDPRAIERCRKMLLDQGLYGDRVTACHVPDLAKAPIPPHCVNLLIGTAGNRLKRDETLRFLAPGNGTAISSGGTIRAPEVPGSGTWTHMYANPDNTGYGGESLGGVQGNERLTLQWIGRPGPRYQSDRGNRKPAPLAVSGRLYIQGLQRIIALDGNNGSIIWSLELPEVQRFNIPRDTSNWCADEDHLYVAGERLLVIDGKTGTLLRTQAAPAPGDDIGSYEWGYVARTGKHLIGSAQRKGNTHTGWWGSQHWYDGKDDFSILKVCSDSLFATDPDTGSVRWRYEPNALIINASITAADGQLVFLEAGDDSLFDQSTRKIEDGRIWEELELVALDQETGAELWRREANPIPGRIAVYTAAANGILYLQTSDTGAFALYAFDLETGASLWRQKFNWETDHHGKHLSRLAIAEGLLYLRPYVLNSRTGEIMRTEFPKGHQCGNYACTTDSIILRAGDLAMWAPLENTVSKWNRVRPDCWISTIPAYGMLLSPEGGGGCSCGSWIESSMGFRPVFEGKPGLGLRTGIQE